MYEECRLHIQIFSQVKSQSVHVVTSYFNSTQFSFQCFLCPFIQSNPMWCSSSSPSINHTTPLGLALVCCIMWGVSDLIFIFFFSDRDEEEEEEDASYSRSSPSQVTCLKLKQKKSLLEQLSQWWTSHHLALLAQSYSKIIIIIIHDHHLGRPGWNNNNLYTITTSDDAKTSPCGQSESIYSSSVRVSML